MQPYSERAAQVVWESTLTVQVLLSSDNNDLEFICLKPGQPYISPEEFTARKLRGVGIVGLCGLKPTCAFNEPLDTPVVESIAYAFLEYTRVLLGENFAEHMQRAEIAELERIYALPDTRLN